MKITKKFEVGHVVLSRDKSIYSKLITLGNLIHYKKKGWTHAGIISEVLENHVIIHEALDKGFVKNKYLKEGLIYRQLSKMMTIGTSRYKLYNVKENCEKYEGSAYAWYDIFLIVLYIFTGKKSFIFSTGANKLICSEADARVLYDSSYKKINMAEEFDKSYDLIMPQDLKESRYLRWD